MKHTWITAVMPLAICLCLASYQLRAETEELLTIGSKAPSIDVEHWVSKGNGKFQQVTDFEKGKVYIIEFWATWCGPCIASMPHLVELQEKYADHGVQLISISDEDLEVVESFLEKPVRGSDDEEMTYGKLTSAYCLTTDPDRSVYSEYMEAAGQNGIPTAFIVGKDGLIEWVGHPMSMDEPLEQILNDSWDREAARAELIASQRRGMIMTSISRAMRSGDADKALEIIDEALEENADNAELVEFLTNLRVRVQVFPATRLAQEGKTEEALAMLRELKEKAPNQVKDIIEVELSILINGEMYDEAAKVLDQIAASETNSIKLNQISWMIYEMSTGADEFSKPLLGSALAAAKKAAELSPREASVLDTYAHLLYRTGNLDEALKVQTKAAELSGDANPDIKEFLEELKKEKGSSDQ
jgi:thiol-disulfide isomerase/thioredoxin